MNNNIIRYAILSMDIEDWQHLDYFDTSKCDLSYSMMDGLDQYLELISELGVPSSFFCVGELAQKIKIKLREISNFGFDIGSHTQTHRRPLTISVQEFEEELRVSKDNIEQICSKPIEGFRAPCFSLDRERLMILPKLGYNYDASRILFDSHPLYGTLDMNGFEQVSNNIFRSNNFFEFQTSTQKIFGKDLPISGGGYLRIFPWIVTKTLLNRYCPNNELYTLYIHPFELSTKKSPPFPNGTNLKTKIRFSLGRKTVAEKLVKLIKLLQFNGFQFTTFSQLRQQLLNK
ncbi:MAG: polysaccharide deacetylase family protein [Planctomycetaceae bacterium]|jgi:peptidoglycan/xylan/chitin deacetylase (PgdA/CDA1 family)|nr:polysaccharide deacetylase family protein [Planctomycetaceae bacterium]